MTDNKAIIRDLLPKAREIGRRGGPLHSIWEVIRDGECYIKGLPVRISADQIITYLREDIYGRDV